MNPIWIDDPQKLGDFIDDFYGIDVIAVDTESDHFHAYQARVCLIQVATPSRVALIDPLALDAQDLAPLFDVFADDTITKILHSCRNDVREIDRDYKVPINSVFDTQIAAKFVGTERNALGWLLKDRIGVDVAKKYQRYDWTRRPIPTEPQKYAAQDVIHLFELRDQFLNELGEWQTPFEQMCQHVAANSDYEEKLFDPEDFRRVRGTKKLDDASRAAARELFIARHELCETINKAALHVFQNKALIELAKTRPKSADNLRRIKGLAPALVEFGADRILQAIRDAESADVPPADPPRAERTRTPDDEKARFNALKSWRNNTAEKLGLPPVLIATNSTLQDIAAQKPATPEQLARVHDVLPWHVERFGKKMLEIVN